MAARKKAVAPPPPAPDVVPLTLEEMLCLPAAFGLPTPTLAQRAVCRVFDGAPLAELADDPDVIAILGGEEAMEVLRPGGERPKEVIFIGPIRGAKTMLMAALALCATQTVDLTRARDGDKAFIYVLSISLHSARQVWTHITGQLERKPALASLLVEIRESESEIEIRQERTGDTVVIKIVAGAAAGGSVISRWLAGVICDEAPRMNGEDKVVNIVSTRESALGRLLPGAQFVAVGSPWGAQGYVFERWKAEFGKPKPGVSVVIYANGPQLNHVIWTPEEIAKLEASSPEAAARDVWVKWGQVESDLLSIASIDDCTRQGHLVLPPERDVEYAAAIDPASRRNAWTLVVKFTREDVDIVALAHQWDPKPGEPLVIKTVLAEMRALLLPYGVSLVITDQWSSDTLREMAHDYGLVFQERRWGGERTFEVYDALRLKLATGRVELPPSPELRADLLAVKRKLTPSGQAIELVKNGRRHADYAPALALACEAYTQPARQVNPAPVAPIDTVFLERIRGSDEATWQQGKRAGSVSWLKGPRKR